MKTETVTVDERFGKEYAGAYTFSEISWAKRNRIIQKHTKYHPVTGQIVSSDNVSIQAELIWASLRGQKPANSPVTLERLLDEDQGIPIELGEMFGKIANRLNALTADDMRFLLEQLDESSRTQLFQSFGFVKNSDGPPQN